MCLAWSDASNSSEMKKTILIIELSTMVTIAPVFGQGYIDFSWFGSGTPQGIQVGSPNSVRSQLPGWYLAGDYSVEAYMAAGLNMPESSLNPIAASKTTFLGGPVTTATGSPASDMSGLWSGGPVDTGLPFGPATIQVRVWYDPNHNWSYYQSYPCNNSGKSSLYTIWPTAKSDPTIPSLDNINFAPFSVANGSYDTPFCIPEPSTFALFALGASSFFLSRRASIARAKQ